MKSRFYGFYTGRTTNLEKGGNGKERNFTKGELPIMKREYFIKS
jgi:hypothetical protein